MAKTRVRPNAVKSRSAGIKPYLEKAKTAFPNMMRRFTQTARDWGQKEAHSENIKPYLFDPDTPYLEMDETFPTPFSLEFPGASSEQWTDVGEPGTEAWRFKCIIHCKHTTRTDKCLEPVKCWYGAWTKLDSGGIKNWRFYDSDGNEITKELKITWESNKGLNGEIWVLPKRGDWGDILNAESEKITAVYTDKGQTEGEYYDPRQRKVITIEAGKSQCLTEATVRCKKCPVDPVMTFDDDSTPDTIASGANITLYVTGGLGPYDWTVSGTGYSLASASTSGVSNTLTAASGACPAEVFSVATITVTDACDTSVTFQIRNTDGVWGTCSSSCCWGTYTGSDAYCYPTGDYSCRLYLQCADDKGNYLGIPYPWTCMVDEPGPTYCDNVESEACTDACPNGWYQAFMQSWRCPV